MYSGELSLRPELLNNDFWTDLNQALLYLALLHLSVVAFAGSILLARAIVPSLVYTGHASESALRLRPVFYVLAAAAGVAVIVMAVLWISSLSVTTDIYGHKFY
jgi:hypothetical protein